MATKRKTVKKSTKAKKPAGAAANTAATPAAAPQSSVTAAGNIRIRMYRLGVGDCFLVRIPKGDGTDLKMLIDCGVHTSQSGGPDLIRKVAANLRTETNDRFDIVVATHDHYDHTSGFLLAPDFTQMTAGEIWCAWTEDETDTLAKQLGAKKSKAIKVVAQANAHAMAGGMHGASALLDSMLGFIGDGSGVKLAAAAKVLKAMAPNNIRYHTPGEPPTELPGGNARVFVLGPPRDLVLIHKADPSKGEKSEAYPFGAYSATAEALDFALGEVLPFDDKYGMPLEAAKADAFFQRHYWRDDTGQSASQREDARQDWRRIDADWLDTATGLALALDNDTNNTSLVLAFEFGPPDKGGPVVLFAADAQVGNWLSWQNVEWPDYHGRKITGPDLLRRTVIYKVGHHASQNATLRTLGLEMMTALELALVPTDEAMATKVGWGTLPWPALLSELDTKTKNKVVRTDRKAPATMGRFKLTEDPLFYEVEFVP